MTRASTALEAWLTGEEATVLPPTEVRARSGRPLAIPLRASQQDVWLYDPWCFTPWYTAALALALRRAGTSLRLVCPRYHYEPNFFAQIGLETDPGPLDLVSRWPLRHAAARQSLRSLEYVLNTLSISRKLGQGTTRVLHLQLCPLLARGIATDRQLVVFAKRRGVRAVHTVHNLLPHDSGAWHHASYARFYGACDRLICHSEDIAERLETEFRIASDRIDVIPHGPLFSAPETLGRVQSRARLGLDPDAFIFLWQGILSPYKGLPLLLDAWSKLLGSMDPYSKSPTLLIAGTGSVADAAAVRDRVARLGDSVRLHLRYIPAVEIPCYYTAADVLLYPYRQITTSGALMTGLHYEKPIIASDLPAFRAVVDHQENGLLLTSYTAEALAQAMRRVLTDPLLFRRLCRGAMANRQRQTQWDEIARRTRLTYERALRRSSTPAPA
ncbi:MAG: glycosyltransferase family 4 protein [Acidobacteriaceae bacterium]